MRLGHPDDDDRQVGDMIRFGRIAKVELSAGRCVVACGEVETASIRWVEGRAGSTRTWSPPAVGEQVLLLCPEGDVAGAVALRGIFSAASPPPGDDLRELIAFADGTLLRYDPEGHLLEVLLQGGSLSISAPQGVEIVGPVTIKGPVSIESDVQVSGTVTADTDVVGGGKSLAGHKHTGVAAGGAVSGPPQ